ncbi:hypothetical protein Tco_0138926 [Tanacetum coccineum]
MDFENYIEAQSIHCKNRFKTYVKSKDKDLWHIIINDDFSPVVKNETDQDFEVVPFENQDDTLKKNLAKNNEAKMARKKRVKSIALKAKKESSIDKTSTSGSKDKEYAMVVRDFKKFFRRKGKFARQPCDGKKSFLKRDEKKGKSDQKCFSCEDPNNLIGDCLKPPRNKDQNALV